MDKKKNTKEWTKMSEEELENFINELVKTNEQLQKELEEKIAEQEERSFEDRCADQAHAWEEYQRYGIDRYEDSPNDSIKYNDGGEPIGYC